MNRANQYALYQATNQGLLGIRQAEINYYISLNVAFGTQAALIGGFTYGIFTQNQINEANVYSSHFQDIYWVSSSGTIAAAVHVILTTMLLQVLGPGLALHGPIGSMARACEGMRKEQKSIITAFIVMIVLFSISTILSFWAVMSLEAATGATAVWLVASRYYYFYCERIYLRFYWKEEQDYWRRSEDHQSDPAGVDHYDAAYEPPVLDSANPNLNPIHGINHYNTPAAGRNHPNSIDRSNHSHNEPLSRVNSVQPGNPVVAGYGHHSTDITASSLDTINKDKKHKRRLFGSLFKGLGGGGGGGDGGGDHSDSDNYGRGNGGQRGPQASLMQNQIADSPFKQTPLHPRVVAMEGFLLIQRASSATAAINAASTRSSFTSMLLTADSSQFKWDRRYFTLNCMGHIFYYKSRVDYRENPRNPVHLRPLVLHDFFVEVYNSEALGAIASADFKATNGRNSQDSSSTPNTTLSSSKSKIFQIALIPRENKQHQQSATDDRTNGSDDDDLSQSDHEGESVTAGSSSTPDRAGNRATGMSRCALRSLLLLLLSCMRIPFHIDQTHCLHGCPVTVFVCLFLICRVLFLSQEVVWPVAVEDARKEVPRVVVSGSCVVTPQKNSSFGVKLCRKSHLRPSNSTRG